MHTLVPFVENRMTQPNGSDIKYEKKNETTSISGKSDQDTQSQKEMFSKICLKRSDYIDNNDFRGY